MRESKELILASKEYAHEVRWLSWWHLWSTLALFSGLIAVAAVDFPLWVRIPASVVAGLVLVRLFILYHDFEHGTILRGSKLANAIFTLYGLLTLNPPSIWNRSHNHHHKNNAKIKGASIGSYPVMTPQAYQNASKSERLIYNITRHPITIACGYATVFLYGMCIRSLIVNPRMHMDSALSLVMHVALIVWLAFVSVDALILAFFVPSIIAAAMGAYLFYAQHNYPDMKIRDKAQWDYVAAALESSSYIKMSKLMHFFTGNIGYHHIHHLNHRIPFYRLPETMAAMPELQSPGTTSLKPRDVIACLRLNLWDPVADRMVTQEEGMRSLKNPSAAAAVVDGDGDDAERSTGEHPPTARNERELVGR